MKYSPLKLFCFGIGPILNAPVKTFPMLPQTPEMDLKHLRCPGQGDKYTKNQTLSFYRYR